MNAFLQTVKETEVPYGTAVLWWLGQMGLMVKMGETVLCIDYFATDTPGRRVPPPIPAREVTDIDIFMGTHDHMDHMDHDAWRLWASQCPEALFVFPALHRRRVEEDGVDICNGRGLNGWDCCGHKGVDIFALPAAHEFLNQDPATGRYPCLQYVIEGNGVRIYHAGDTLRYEGMLPALKEFGRIDAALLPINGRDATRYRRNCIGNMTYQEAADLAGELRPGLVIPGHWDMFADNPGDPDAFADYLEVKYEGQIPCLKPQILAPIQIRAGA